MIQPEYIFEISWEVCNRVGGIYAVLSTKAATMQAEHPDKVIFFGPDLGKQSDRFFKADHRLLSGKLSNKIKGISYRVGRWQIPGQPLAVLVKWDHLLTRRDDLYAWAWERYHVQSHAAYGDYHECCLFSYAAAEVMQQLFVALNKPLTVMQSHEWQTAFALLYIRQYCPQIATIFTTHATSIGRSIAGNGKPLYDYFTGYNGDGMAQELNMVSKHSLEKQAAHAAHCFTTVSDITARECGQLLERLPNVVTPNGFEQQFVPQGAMLTAARRLARKTLLRWAEKQTGNTYDKDTLLVAISGRLEWKNKGIDVFLDAMNYLAEHRQNKKQAVVAFVMIPYLQEPIRRMGDVTVLYMPWYLPTWDADSVLNGHTYFSLLPGMDITAFPSYYEPWGYTPLESIAFHVPTITTSLAGFGVWARAHQTDTETMKPVTVIERTDSNYHEVVRQVAENIDCYSQLKPAQQTALRKQALALARQAEWSHFFYAYKRAYTFALNQVQEQPFYSPTIPNLFSNI